MKVSDYKGVTVVPFAPLGTAKSSEQDPFATDANQDINDFFAQAADSGLPETNPASDPFGTLRAMLEGTVAPLEAQVPTAEELVAKYPTLNMFADGSIEAEYERLRFQYQQQLAQVEQQLATPVLTPTEQKQLVTQQQALGTALMQIDEEIARARTIAKQAHATYTQEKELMKQVGLGELDAAEADLNGDGRIGNPLEDRLILGKRTIDGIEEISILDEKTMKPVKFDTDGNPIGPGIINPKYQWDLTKSGLSLDINGAETEGFDLVVSSNAELLAARETYEGSGANFQAQLDIPIPEAFYVEKYADGSPRIVNDAMVPAPTGDSGLLFAPPTDPENYVQVKVTDVELGSSPDGTYHTLTFKDGSGHTIFRMKLLGAQDKSIALTNGAGAFAGDAELKNKIRTSPVHIHVSDTFRSTAKIGNGSVDGVEAPPAATNGEGVDRGQGVFILGLRGYFEGSSAYDVFDIPPPPADAVKGDPEYATIVDAGESYNAIRSRDAGDIFASGITYADIKSTKDDHVYVSTPGALSWISDDKTKWGANPKAKLTIDTPNGEVFIDNQVEKKAKLYDQVLKYGDQPTMDDDGPTGKDSAEGQDGKPKVIYTADDEFNVTAGETYYSDIEAKETTKAGSSDGDKFDINDKAVTGEEMQSKLLDWIRAEEEADIEGEALDAQAWEAYGPIYNEAQEEMTAFFSSYADWSGVGGTTAAALGTDGDDDNALAKVLEE